MTAQPPARAVDNGHTLEWDPPHGLSSAECGFKHCVAPEHVDDTETRIRDRQALRIVLGKRPAKPTCRRGHDQTVDGRRSPDGGSYCEGCRREQRGTTPRRPQ